MPDATVSQGHNVGQQDGDDGVHAPAANAGDGAGQDQLPNVGGQAAAETAEGEDDVGEEKALLSAKDVTQLAVEGLCARQGEKVAT